MTDRLVFLQLQKTASTHIELLLGECFGGEKIGKHNRLDFDPGDRLVFGSIRDPWSWYVSLWAFGCGGGGRLRTNTTQPVPRRRALARRLLTDGRAAGAARVVRDFAAERRRPAEQWRALYADVQDVDAFRTWLRMVFDRERAHDLSHDYAASSIHRVAGLLTYRYLFLFSRDVDSVLARDRFASIDDLLAFDERQNLCADFVRVESLLPDLERVLARAGYDLGPDDLDRLRATGGKKRNVSKRRPVTDYYDEASIDLVASNEQFVIRRFGYEAPLLSQPT